MTSLETDLEIIPCSRQAPSCSRTRFCGASEITIANLPLCQGTFSRGPFAPPSLNSSPRAIGSTEIKRKLPSQRDSPRWGKLVVALLKKYFSVRLVPIASFNIRLSPERISIRATSYNAEIPSSSTRFSRRPATNS